MVVREAAAAVVGAAVVGEAAAAVVGAAVVVVVVVVVVVGMDETVVGDASSIVFDDEADADNGAARRRRRGRRICGATRPWREARGAAITARREGAKGGRGARGFVWDGEGKKSRIQNRRCPSQAQSSLCVIRARPRHSLPSFVVGHP